MPSDLTIVAVTKRFVIGVDDQGLRERIETPGYYRPAPMYSF